MWPVGCFCPGAEARCASRVPSHDLCLTYQGGVRGRVHGGVHGSKQGSWPPEAIPGNECFPPDTSTLSTVNQLLFIQRSPLNKVSRPAKVAVWWLKLNQSKHWRFISFKRLHLFHSGLNGLLLPPLSIHHTRDSKENNKGLWSWAEQSLKQMEIFSTCKNVFKKKKIRTKVFQTDTLEWNLCRNAAVPKRTAPSRKPFFLYLNCHFSFFNQTFSGTSF